nr:MAG TPA: hypothetical protein [Caudoviricetes sp.]
MCFRICFINNQVLIRFFLYFLYFLHYLYSYSITDSRFYGIVNFSFRCLY